MMIYEQAVSIAKLENQWQPRPNKKRKTQEIQLAKELGSSWKSENPKEDVDLIALEPTLALVYLVLFVVFKLRIEDIIFSA
ncbi:hypothetical protein [Clostridium estertheticum]|uniref:hypothetical protein n=1 Tax=Clostridium estertheticum TaxID=238834 RepID=UPI001CF5A758|nr:hypothetical protein [Clostridium estertheticum]MCB2354588.1 hypothetical protein [Clostridium estertheticum]MCB2358514.1 hypothetical protein [Clostridium estertheticum]WAG40836.1 hypothetical protein LL065_21715 [Clostridium estertheticum]